MKLTIRWLSAVFFLSGLSALIFQVVWQRALTLYYGVGPISITLIVSIYMAGLGLGALLGGYLAEKYEKRIEIYAVIELLVGCFGLVSLNFLDFVGKHTAGSPYAVAAVCMIVYLLVPTLLMGITLPLLTKIFNSYIDDFLGTISFLYFINTLGAAVGSLFASYVLISFFGLDIAVDVACAINFTLAFTVILLIRCLPKLPSSHHSHHDLAEGNLGRWVYACVFITGFLAIGYEIIWFRVIGILVKGTAYVFPTTLAVYLAGIALGSLFMGRWLHRHPQCDKQNLFFLLQFSLGILIAAIFLKYYYLSKFTPFGSLTMLSFRVQDHPMLMFGDPAYLKDLSWGLRSYLLLDILWWSFFFVFLPTLLMGASFPLISRLALTQDDKEGRTVAQVYFFNVMGNVFGGALTGFVLLHCWGTELTLMVFTAIGLCFGFWLKRIGPLRFSMPLRAGVIGLLIMLIIQWFPRSGDLYRLMHSFYKKEFLHAYFEEGMDAVVLTEHTDAETTNFIGGTTQGGRPAFSFYAQTAESMTYVPELQKALVLGYGTGGVVEAILKSDFVEKVRVVELSQSLIDNLEKIKFFKDMLADPKVDLVVDDARRYLTRSEEKYDLIVSFLVRSTTAYSNNIYSKEFFELVSRRLNPGGVFLLWIHDPLIISRTVATVFPYVHLYQGVGNISAIASMRELKQDPKIAVRVVSKFAPQERPNIIGSYPQFRADRAMMLEKTKGYPVNADLKPHSEYYVGEFFRKRQ